MLTVSSSQEDTVAYTGSCGEREPYVLGCPTQSRASIMLRWAGEYGSNAVNSFYSCGYLNSDFSE